MCTCADEEHVVSSLVQAVDPIHRQPREVDTLGEQQGASQSFVLHQRVFLGKVERGVRQLQRAVVAVLPVIVSNTLQHRQRPERRGWGNGGRERMWAKPRKRSMTRRKVLSCSWHRLAWLLGYEKTALSLSLSPSSSPTFFHSDFHLRLPSHPFLSYWIITFMAVLCCASLSYFPFPSLKCPHSTTAFLLPPQALIAPPQAIHLSYCYKRCTKHQTSSHQTLRASFLPIQAVGRGRCRCSAPIFARPPCTLCTIFQTRPWHHWSDTGTLRTRPRHPWNIRAEQWISDVCGSKQQEINCCSSTCRKTDFSAASWLVYNVFSEFTVQ